MVDGASLDVQGEFSADDRFAAPRFSTTHAVARTAAPAIHRDNEQISLIFAGNPSMKRLHRAELVEVSTLAQPSRDTRAIEMYVLT